MTEERRVASTRPTGAERPEASPDDGRQDGDGGGGDSGEDLRLDVETRREDGVAGDDEAVRDDEVASDDETTGDRTAERPDDHLQGVEAGAGCTEIWEHLSKRREE